MTLPGSYIFSILLLILSMLCWGSWANTFKAAGKWRFELYYFDFAVGVFIAALVAAFTVGTLGLDGFTVFDDFGLAGKRQEMYALSAGIVFNLANMLLLAAASVSGIAIAFPIGIGLALVIGATVNYFVQPAGSPVLLAAGCAAVLGGIVFDGVAWKRYAARRSALAKEAAAAQQADQPVKAKAEPKKKASSGKGLLLATIGGILMGFFYPVIQLAKEGENGLGPYSAGLIFGAGVLFSTFIFNLFFMNLPVQGQAVEFSELFRSKGKNHLLGLLGGVLCFTGAISNFVAARAEGPALVGPSLSYAIGQGAMLVTALWGLIVWKEFAGAESGVRSHIGIMLVLFVAGVAAVSLAPLYGAAH